MSNLSNISSQRHQRQHQPQRVKLTLSAAHLRNPRNSGMRMSVLRTVTAGRQGSSSPSPFAEVTKLGAFGSDEEDEVIGRTEEVPYTKHPNWTKYFKLDFEFGREQFIDVTIYTYDGDEKIKMGSAKVDIGIVLGTKRNRLMVNLSQPSGGRLYAHVAPLDDNDRYDENSKETMVRMEVSANLKKKKMRIVNRTYFEIQTQAYYRSGTVWTPIYRSSIANNEKDKDIDSDWSNCMFNLSDVLPQKKKGISDAGRENLNEPYSENLNEPLRIMVWNHRKRKKHAVLGSVETSLAELKRQCTNSHPGATFPLFKDNEATESIITIKDVKFIGGNDSDHMSQDMTSEEITSAADTTNRDIDAQRDREEGVQNIATGAVGEKGANSANEGSSNPPSVVHMHSSTSLPQATKAPISTPVPTFIDYLCGGCEINLMVAIDFTRSNGSPMDPGTPHDINPRSTSDSDVRNLNEYEQAIVAIGDILVKYDTDKMVPVWGFGAKFEGITRHIFQVGGKPEVHGVKGILEAYRALLKREDFTMSSPTVLSEVMKRAAITARKNYRKALEERKQSYSVLLILTHGSLSNHEVENTMKTLQSISDSPLSVIIVGIGQNDFGPMRKLDDFQNDVGGGRDICDFVEFDSSLDRSFLTRETLNEIPDQLVSYFTERDIYPMKLSNDESTCSIDSEPSNDVDDSNYAGGQDYDVDDSNHVGGQDYDLDLIDTFDSQ